MNFVAIMNERLQSLLQIATDLTTRLSLALRKPEYNSKVFCIGFNKTGTKSFAEAMKVLGYRHATFSKRVWRKYYKNNEIVKILQYTAKFDSADDLPWLKEDMIPVLDRVFPNSKFIYLTRDEESWKKSIYNWTFKLTGAYPDVEEKLREFREHKAFVMEYFRDRPKEQFLILDVRKDNALQTLAEFLGKKTHATSMPHFNETNPSR